MPKPVAKKTALARRYLIKNWRLVVPTLVILVAAFVAASGGGSCSWVYRNDEVVRIGSVAITTEIAQTNQEKIKGLGGRACIDDEQGMLFIYDKPGFYSFWMKDMKFPIDIIWIGSDYRVVDIEKHIKPSTYPKSFTNNAKPAQYVLEIKAGRANQLGITLGTPVNL